MIKASTQRLRGYLLLIYCLCPTPTRSQEMKMINIPYGTSCNTTDFRVDQNSVFNIDTLAHLSDGDNEFVDCEILFTSSREDGRLCVIQEGPVSEIRDSNVELTVRENTKTAFELKYYPSSWLLREYCTKSPSLSVALKKINKNVRVNVSKVAINLTIADLESRYRTLYFNDISCDKSYQLRHSWVSVYNRSPYSPKTLKYCGLKVEKEADNNGNICLVYKPLLHSQREDTAWNFYVSTKEFDLDPNFFIYQLAWNSSQARELHAWCADPEIGSVTLIFHRINTTNEQQDMFVFTLTDYSGSNDTLLELWSNNPSTDTGPGGIGASSSQLSVSLTLGLVIFIVTVGLIMTASFVLFMDHYCKKVAKVTNVKIDHLDSIQVLDGKSSAPSSLKAYPATHRPSHGGQEQTCLTDRDARKQKINDDLLKFLQGNRYHNMSLLKQKSKPPDDL
ncbi:unnamed protein product [Lymnaea stagnalis]|uniref:Uncharacterized protein n=1 Tax=Lymnaea stagnalis TaxID=6523 RepID=A0AAV2HR09_LYMST